MYNMAGKKRRARLDLFTSSFLRISDLLCTVWTLRCWFCSRWMYMSDHFRHEERGGRVVVARMWHQHLKPVIRQPYTRPLGLQYPTFISLQSLVPPQEIHRNRWHSPISLIFCRNKQRLSNLASFTSTCTYFRSQTKSIPHSTNLHHVSHLTGDHFIDLGYIFLIAKLPTPR